MAWPATPLLTFINGSAPACDASFLNSLQAGVNGLCLGTYSYKAISVDGTGGLSVTPPSGTIQVSASASNAAITQYALYKEQIPFAWCMFSIVAGLMSSCIGANINTSSATRTSAGVYSFTLKTAVPDSTKAAIICSPQENTDQAASGGVIVNGNMHSTTQVNIWSQTTGGTASDVAVCSFVLYSL